MDQLVGRAKAGELGSGLREHAEGAQSIGRALRLLHLLGTAGPQGATLGALVQMSGLAKPTCRRLLLALIAEGMAEQDEQTRRYFLGRETFLLGMLANERHGIHQLAQDCVERLARETGDAAFLQVRHGDDVLCLLRADGDFPLRSHVLKAGDRHPLGVGGGGIALLAALPPREVEALMVRLAGRLAARYPVVAPRVVACVEECRQRGYGMNRGTVFPGSWGMGVAIHDPEGAVNACLSLAAVESRLQPDREEMLAALLTREARVVEERLAQLSKRNAAKRAAPLVTHRRQT